ncbi:hypothetical protein GCM10025879_03140 [Leuconostoc litchii]|uniref:Helix-turn-helix domain-containing protein n=1 Tax=Leuconostoc litchii TaxID=1981069 RepID=A0A6P2CM74_9LACO|nr:helix-turn-helix domain-containing protein [Leuconostoc litchii]TYC47115.1 helix-turn-helix domain-containing protein [Leuconostoc litchii]GMA69068.1 hypothetical protein GCM10025879_03140 [Leuconostoc litchii]
MRDTDSSIIKEQRKLRHISQVQLGNAIGSQAMVSRIENGQILPNAQTIFTLCRELELTFDEYFSNSFGTFENITAYKCKLDFLYKTENTAEIHMLYNQITNQSPLNLKTKHRLLMIKSTLYHNSFKIANSIDQHTLFSYFDEIVNWHTYDVYLFESIINMLPAKKIKSYFLDILEQYNVDKNTTIYPDIVNSIVIKYLETSIIQQQDNISSFLLQKIEDDNFCFDANQQLFKLFLTGIYLNDDKKINNAYNVAEWLNDAYSPKIFNRISAHFLKKNIKKSSLQR